ncbi:MAG: DUF2306 domain-containing protein [Bacteroidia bacterium]|nr:DUF2306 domain-containing protein [Bacteroidia bacterium]
MKAPSFRSGSGRLAGVVLLAAYAGFCWLMWGISMQYTGLDPDAAFLRIKQDYTGMLHYRIAFFIHAFASLLALPAGFTQFSASFRRRWPQAHRRLGYVYIAGILLLAGPTGFVLAVYANGGWSSQLAFVLLAAGWWYFTWQALRAARRRQWRLHRDWMYRSFALTLSAITLRAWKYGLVALFHPPPMDVYRLVAWLGWTVNLLAAEAILLYRYYPNRIPQFLLHAPLSPRPGRRSTLRVQPAPDAVPDER